MHLAFMFPISKWETIFQLSLTEANLKFKTYVSVASAAVMVSTLAVGGG